MEGSVIQETRRLGGSHKPGSDGSSRRRLLRLEERRCTPLPITCCCCVGLPACLLACLLACAAGSSHLDACFLASHACLPHLSLCLSVSHSSLSLYLAIVSPSLLLSSSLDVLPACQA